MTKYNSINSKEKILDPKENYFHDKNGFDSETEGEKYGIDTKRIVKLKESEKKEEKLEKIIKK
jgi:hypothetical protein